MHTGDVDISSENFNPFYWLFYYDIVRENLVGWPALTPELKKLTRRELVQKCIDMLRRLQDNIN
jgi:hypothetical protein